MIDGGVKMNTIVPLVHSGANYLVCGSSTIYNKSGTVEHNIKHMKDLIDNV